MHIRFRQTGDSWCCYNRVVRTKNFARTKHQHVFELTQINLLCQLFNIVHSKEKKRAPANSVKILICGIRSVSFTHGGLLGGRGPSNIGFFNSSEALQLMYLPKATGSSLTDRNKQSALITAQPFGLVHVIHLHHVII